LSRSAKKGKRGEKRYEREKGKGNVTALSLCSTRCWRPTRKLGGKEKKGERKKRKGPFEKKGKKASRSRSRLPLLVQYHPYRSARQKEGEKKRKKKKRKVPENELTVSFILLYPPGLDGREEKEKKGGGKGRRNK